MAYTPNKYQEKILDWARTGKGNALVEARAGSGKTSTLLLLADVITDELKKPCLFIAFNTHIAEEIREKLSKKVKDHKLEVATVNSVGYRFILSNLWINHTDENKIHKDNYILQLDEKKMYTIIQPIVERELANNFQMEGVDQEEVNDICYEFKQLCDLVRATYIPYQDEDSVANLIVKNGLFTNVNDHGINFATLVSEVIDKDIEMFTNPVFSQQLNKYVHIIDYGDQIFLPLKLGMWAPKMVREFGANFILCDEAQDLSNAQQRLLQKCGNYKIPTRYIFVADEQQAIYGFAGADTHSVEHIKEKFSLSYFPLNICYRCPKGHIRLIQEIVPDIEENPNGIEGEIHTISNSEIADLAQNGDYIIARKNKDLVSIMIKILKQGKSIYIKDDTLVKTTLSNIRKLKCKTISELKVKLKMLQEEFQEQQKDPTKRISTSAITNDSMDIYDTIFILLENYEEQSKDTKVSAFIKYIEKILNTDKNRPSIVLSSVHSVKGGEADTVFIVSHNKFPYISDLNTVDQNQQERNLEYIALSRSKSKLYLCTDYGNEDEDEDEEE